MDLAHPTRSAMDSAIEFGLQSRLISRPNPWVGAHLIANGEHYFGRTQAPGDKHAEIEAIAQAKHDDHSELFVTLEPCSHYGRTPPCADSIIDAGIAKVSVSLLDPDPKVFGRGVERLIQAGVEVEIGASAVSAALSLAPYIKQRTTGRPWVVLKSAMSIDGRVAAPDGTSKWITGPQARSHSHGIRRDSDAIIVGSGTVKADDPLLTVRDGHDGHDGFQPTRIVLGSIPTGAKILPAESFVGELEDLLDDLGARGMVQVLIEGGPTVASEFHRRGLVDQYSIYLAPAIFGTDLARSAFGGSDVQTMGDLWRGTVLSTSRLGPDLYLEMISKTAIEMLDNLIRSGSEAARRLGTVYFESKSVEEELCSRG